ncbi:hypothetical protein IGI04_037052 [Brassica rapa subsp. trilocularis]|uniref:Uncharacterized protein n=1 Tax=Brassica rapa subsp. trilocularis TaxID=1813537 RepID=A0ABQ7LGA0_BRACM|nr:hypothetical protein IGI04_037052 [Brassica rapa subsp. trilocularis]
MNMRIEKRARKEAVCSFPFCPQSSLSFRENIPVFFNFRVYLWKPHIYLPNLTFIFSCEPLYGPFWDGPFWAVLRLERFYDLSKERLRNDVGSEEGSNFLYIGGSSSSSDDSDRDETRAGSIQSRRKKLRGRDKGRLVDPTCQTGELDDLIDPTCSFGKLDGAFGLDDRAL